jgi:hypothetical protein
MNLGQSLTQAEEQWLKTSFDFLQKEFKGTPLPSHDHRHHYRVWTHARKLLSEIEKLGITAEPSLVEALLLASMFHDAGMLKEKAKEHGNAGAEIFLEFIEQSSNRPARMDDILDAIRDHDDKSYYLAGRLIKEGKIHLLPALQISDDLDAFGYIGVYRYSEIYLLRGIPMEDIGLKIIANLSGRYGNFMSNCSRIPEMIKIHSMRQHTIESFFRHYNLQIRKKEDTGEEPVSGPVEVVKQIYRQVMMNTPTIEDICRNVVESTQDNYVQRFFTSLGNELEAFTYPAG